MKSAKFKNLCVKEITNNISELEKKQFLALLEESEQNKIEFEKFKQIYESTSPNKFEYEINMDDEWGTLNSKIKMETKTKENTIDKILGWIYKPRLKPALAFSTTLVIIVTSLFWLTNLESEKILKTIATSNNQKLEVQLNDGSIVHLNSGSAIEFFKNFEENKREIRLEGEAFFSVKKDGRPFIISTENAVTTVLGTKFNVWARENETRVIVKEGKVSLAETTIEENKVFITKGQTSKVVAHQSPEKPRTINTENMLGWMEGKLIFDNTSLTEIVLELERVYDVPVTLENAELSNYNLTGTFDNEEIDTVLTKICLALNLKYIESKNSFKVTK